MPFAASLLRTALIGLLACLLVTTAEGKRARAADDATSAARSHYEVGLRLFDAREHDQALLEFQAAYNLKPRPAALFMMAQCEYLLGRLKAARVHYQTYASENSDGEFVELAKDRIESIDKRPSTFVINTVPEDVDVRIVSETAPGQPPVTGQAPNNFSVPRGRYRITVTKANFLQQSRVVEIDLADTRPLFFKLEPIPARLEVETTPPGATLYVNGNRARNPYRQDVVPGHYELFAEAPDWQGRSVEFTLNPGERLLMTEARRLRLQYIQRSGRPELMVATALLFSFGGAAAVAAAIGKPLESANVSAVLLTSGGGLTGAAIGALGANALVPPYIADNRALFIISAMWIGAAEGAGVGIAWEQAAANREAPDPRCPGCRPSLGERLRAGFLGSLPGLALGITSGALMSKHAPTYGRVSLIQSAAIGGLVAGGLVAMAMKWKPYGEDWEHQVRTLPAMVNDSCKESPLTSSERKVQYDCILGERSLLDLTLPALIGLNVGLGAGLLGAYLPDQSHYGPTWRRVLLVDLATVAGTVGGGIAGCVAVDNCLNDRPTDNPSAKDISRAKAAIAALIGGGVGALAGVLLTRNLDDSPERSSAPPPANITVLPAPSPSGGVMPMLSAFGAF